ncbi:MAG: peptidylprolyl isomerase [Balneolaceae bacterium]
MQLPKLILITFIALCFSISCSDSEPLQRSEIIKTEYPQVAKAITKRNSEQLLMYANLYDGETSSLIWKALAKSTIDDLDSFLGLVTNREDRGPWYALSFQDLNENQLNRIHNQFSEGKINTEFVCDLFYRKGNQETLSALLSVTGFIENNELCALAVGGIISRTPIDDEMLAEVASLAFNTQRSTIRRNLLYGFYRNQLNSPDYNTALYRQILTFWVDFGIGSDPKIDQYMARILSNDAVDEILSIYSDQDLREKIQLSIELARSLQFLESDPETIDLIYRLLNHPKTHVKVEVLESLKQFESVEENLLTDIEDWFVKHGRNGELIMTGIEVLFQNGVDIHPYQRKIEFIALENPYSMDKIFNTYHEIEPDEEFFARIEMNIQRGEIASLQSMRALSLFWTHQEQHEKWRDRIRDIIFKVLEDGNRSSVAGMNPLLMDEMLFDESDADRLHRLYSGFVENGNRDNAGVLGEVLSELIGEEFTPENMDKPFRIPNWKRLYELGKTPYWKLETRYGEIEIKLDPETAPFTVSSIDSLTRSGVYDGVVFHRVVRNFVIQGGDYDRRDGFGGPDYRLPTEPSFQSFERGAVGIASSGTDTEGSQYFIMHQWAPHLDGNYTRFGKVVRGMDIVDRIQLGDKVLKASMIII